MTSSDMDKFITKDSKDMGFEHASFGLNIITDTIKVVLEDKIHRCTAIEISKPVFDEMDYPTFMAYIHGAIISKLDKDIEDLNSGVFRPISTPRLFDADSVRMPPPDIMSSSINIPRAEFISNNRILYELICKIASGWKVSECKDTVFIESDRGKFKLNNSKLIDLFINTGILEAMEDENDNT